MIAVLAIILPIGLYVILKDNFNTAKSLLQIAIIQKNEKDFIGSEVTSIEAISLLESLKEDNEIIKYNVEVTIFDVDKLIYLENEAEKNNAKINVSRDASTFESKVWLLDNTIHVLFFKQHF